ncbi:MAG: 1-deoxy-D-xylulose-5-phosphate reductoisomerase [Gammaproteobacteria bacterium]|nr:1-deoxy-D-xylulose-5-phosphate reductoisomerase [Gammaproteobacteria bacterium]MBU6508812.1 1-deoxy-D-xylulose-5-phosphate reductoisomerase [Gammaproteobacteria bacterium]MDE1983146.1 1-deoxy-D-xylulose-5-phosphate reductoisomerase [Gammaproteobacteria bacterium]MDE2460882.1 1-deoxy-D-xylulose-5-phosphate reductoisomerase [Gammaproteobacteria bacterium]
MKGVTILGATGSIGVSTLDVLARHPDRYRVVALTARGDVERLLQQCLAHHPRYAVMVEEAAARELRAKLKQHGEKTEVLAGARALEEVAALAECDYVMAAIVGAAGLLATLAAVKAGKRVLLANKESLVMTGALFMRAVRDHGAELLPIDSEHNALFQCMPGGYRAGMQPPGVRRLLLTCSGGPFRGWSREQRRAVTPDQACAHPRWKMGRKISVDSATLMNKGLEVNEARWLFDLPAERIEVVVHPQSVVHSLVEYADGSVLAQLGNPDMRTPIACGLAWPERIQAGIEPLDLFSVARLDFEPPDVGAFPCLGLAIEAAKAGGSAPLVLNAANEISVQAFLSGKLRFTAIAEVVDETLQRCALAAVDSIEAVLERDRRARRLATDFAVKLMEQPA